MRGVFRHHRNRRARWLAAAVLLAAPTSPAPALAGIIGQWDFSRGWDASSGVIANLGSSSSTVVMRVPDMRGYGLVTGLMAQFPNRVNGDGAPTKLNRYSIMMDVYVPGSTDAAGWPPYYLTLLQTRLGLDGAWLINKRDDTTGVASSYGGAVTPDAWHRVALVMNLDDSGAVSQYRAYVDGALAAEIVPDLVPVDESPRNDQLVNGDPLASPPIPPDLYTDGLFSIGTLNDSYAGLGNDSAFFLFNADRNDAIDGPTKGELGMLYVANLQFRDDALSSPQMLALGGPGPGFIPVPEPAGLGLAGAAAAAAALARRRSRRRFLREAGISVAGAALAAPPLHADQAATAARPAAPPARGPLADYVLAPDPTTRWARIAGGELGAGRFLAAELVSQTWRGGPWRHQFAICRPAKPAVPRPPLVLWVDGGSTPEGDVQPPAKQLPILAAIAEASGLPVAVVRQVPNQPLEGGRREDDLIAHTFEQFFESGDPASLLLLPMVKTVAAALDAAGDLASREWDLDLDGCIVTGASKRGWTSWLAAAVEPRVRGLVPMVIDMLDLPRHMRLQVESFGAPSEALHDYVSRGLHRRLDSPRGAELLAIVDPVRHAAAITQPKILALGTNDAYWPLESLDLYRPALRGPTWVSYAPNAGHDLPPLRVAPLVAALGRHVAGVEELPALSWTCDPAARSCAIDLDAAPDETLLWTADAGSRDFRRAAWSSRPAESAGGHCHAVIEPPAAGFRAALLECRFARRPQPVYLSTGPLVVAAG